MGGRNDERFGAASPSGRFCRGFFSSINDRVSITRFATGLEGSTTFDGGSGCARVFGAVAAGVDRVSFAGASTLTLFASLRLGSAVLLATVALTGLRAVAGLRAAVLVVVFVGMVFLKNRHGWPIRGKPVYCTAGVS
jgi:hypothetical protein